jgi:ABC-type transport system involved in multi-copper enzyme maturation permease subunit
MSSAAVARARKSFSEAPWQLWASQLKAVLRIEIKKTLWMRRSIWIYLLAFAPTVMFGIHALTSPMGRNCSIEEDTRVLAYTFQIFYLRVGIFFGCMGLFTWLFRGEIVEKSLHYYFLSPMRRELLVAGKFLAGFITASLVFGASVLLGFAFVYGHFGAAGRAFVFSGPGLVQLGSYLLVTVLACLGFGSIFLALSLIFKNPILPGVAVLLWESFHAVAPSLLQKLSVTFYLKQLCPVTIPPEGLMALFTVVAEPVSAWIAVPGLLCLCTAILFYACMRIRRTEISYLAD